MVVNMVYNNNVRNHNPLLGLLKIQQILIPNLWKPSHDALGSERYCLVSIITYKLGCIHYQGLMHKEYPAQMMQPFSNF
jgi:hypothetical protein